MDATPGYGAGDARPVAARETDEPLPSPELALTDEPLEGLDWQLVESKLPLCAARLDLQPSTERQALVDLLVKLDLAGGDRAAPRLTVGGLRLLGRRASAQVVVRWDMGERTFSGNMFELIDKVRDALAELNEPYRLKGPRSVDVRAFEPLALKEFLVNALVHRDYDAPGPVRITLTAADITSSAPEASSARSILSAWAGPASGATETRSLPTSSTGPATWTSSARVCSTFDDGRKRRAPTPPSRYRQTTRSSPRGSAPAQRDRQRPARPPTPSARTKSSTPTHCRCVRCGAWSTWRRVANPTVESSGTVTRAFQPHPSCYEVAG